MTVKEFQKALKTPNRFIDIVDYSVCLVFIAVGLYFITMLNSLLDIILCVLFISIGLYGFWRISKNYVVDVYSSGLTKEQKIKLIEQYLHTKKGFSSTDVGELVQYHYTGTFFADVCIVMYADDKQLFVNVNTLGTPRGSGFIDFGSAYRARKRLHLYLKDKFYRV